jgi:hypothetical protein
MDKKQLIKYINIQFKGNLTPGNTSYSSINNSKAVWWLNIHVSKFVHDVHLLLNAPDHAIWIKLPKGFVTNLPNTFKIREDKNAVDLEISADRNLKYLIDLKSGGYGFDFKILVKEKIAY